MIFTFRDRSLEMGVRPLIMGIVNVTPDSFSDGGAFACVDKAVEHALELEKQGADMLDIGGESTRPGHSPVTAEEEKARILPVIRELRRQTTLPISADTMKGSVAVAAVEAGADIINDVTGFEMDFVEKCTLLRKTGVGAVLMHWNRSATANSQEPAKADDGYVQEVNQTLKDRILAVRRATGLSKQHFMADPGIGFAKSDAQNLQLLRGLPSLGRLGYPVLLGISRKSFIGRILNEPDPQQRLLGTAAAVAIGAWLNADVLRVHDVSAMREVLKVVQAIRQPSQAGIWK